MTADGDADDVAKRSYAQSFGIYAAAAMRIDRRDVEAAKTMNTQLSTLFDLLLDTAYDAASGHFRMHFSPDWSAVNDHYSFGPALKRLQPLSAYSPAMSPFCSHEKSDRSNRHAKGAYVSFARALRVATPSTDASSCVTCWRNAAS